MLIKYAKLLMMSVLTLSAVAVNAQTIKGTVALPGSPIGVAVNPLSNRIYAAVPTSNGIYDYLSVINGKKDVDIKDIKIPPVAFAVAVDDVRGLVYVGGVSGAAAANGASQVAVVSAVTNTVLTTVTVTPTSGPGVVALAVNPVSGTVYAANSSDNEVDVIKVVCGKKVTGSVTARISVGAGIVPSGVSVNFVSNTVYASLLNGTIDTISGKTNTITATTVFGIYNQGIAVDNVNGNVIVASQPANGAISSVGVLSSAGAVLANISVGNTAVGVDVDPLTHLAFVANSGDPSVDVISEATNAVTGTVSVDSLFLAVNPVTEKVYVTPASSATLLTVVTE